MSAAGRLPVVPRHRGSTTIRLGPPRSRVSTIRVYGPLQTMTERSEPHLSKLAVAALAPRLGTSVERPEPIRTPQAFGGVDT